MTANLDQSGSQEYVSDAIKYIRIYSSSITSKGSTCDLNFASIALCQVVISGLLLKEAALNELNLMSHEDLSAVIDFFKKSLLAQLKALLKTAKQSAKPGSEAIGHIGLLSIIEALASVGVDGSKLAELRSNAMMFIESIKDTENEVASRLEAFISVNARDIDGCLVDGQLNGDISTVYGRQGVINKADAVMAEGNQEEKLELLRTLFLQNRSASLLQLDNLLAIKCIISACKGLSIFGILKRKANFLDARRSSEEDEGADPFDLSMAYSKLCDQLREASSVRQFLLISEIMEMMLRTKVCFFYFNTLTALIFHLGSCFITVEY